MTHLELLQTLPSPYREQAIENCTQPVGWLSKQGKNLPETVLRHSKWADTPQGHDQWEVIWQRALDGEFDDPSVTLPMEDWEELIESAQKGRCANKLIEAIQSQLNPKQ